MATSQQIIDDARTDLAIDPGKDIWSDAQLLRYLNEAVSFIYAKAAFKFEYEDYTITPLVDGQASYAFPSDYRMMLWAKVLDTTAASTEADESPIEVITDFLSDFQQTHDMDMEGDTPGYIYEEGGEFKLYPVPNAAAAAKWEVHIKYSEYPATLTVLDTPAFPSEWHFVLTHFIRYRAFGSKPGPQNKTFAQDALSEWELWSAKAIADMLHRQNEKLTYYAPILPAKSPK